MRLVELVELAEVIAAGYLPALRRARAAAFEAGTLTFFAIVVLL
jgi:hypothetical protein